MSSEAENPPNDLLFQVLLPAESRSLFEQLCAAQNLAPERAASLLLFGALKLIADHPNIDLHDIPTGLAVAASEVRQTHARACQILGVFERLIIDSETLNLAVRNRLLTTGSDGIGGKG